MRVHLPAGAGARSVNVLWYRALNTQRPARIKRQTRTWKVLRGGYLNGDRIIKAGRRIVRHQDHRWPLAVEEALGVLARRGFTGSPRQVRRLNARSVVLTYLPGRTVSDPPPRWATQPATLAAVTDFVHHFSLIGAGVRCDLEHSDWLVPPSSDGDVLVHGDPHPTNIVFDHRHRPTGIIDFELATVGTHDWNLISLAFCWGPLEPVKFTVWRSFAGGWDATGRVATILRLWNSPSPSRELLDVGREFLDWRKRWITQLAEAGNAGALAFVASPSFQERLAYAAETLRRALR